MAIKLIVFLLLCFIVVNLFVGLFHIVRGKEGGGNRVARSLTLRVCASIVLFALVLAIVYFTTPQA